MEKVQNAADLSANLVRAGVNEDQTTSPDPIPYIKRTTQTGEVEIYFTKEMMEIPDMIDLTTLEYRLSRFEWAPVMTVSITPSAV